MIRATAILALGVTACSPAAQARNRVEYPAIPEARSLDAAQVAALPATRPTAVIHYAPGARHFGELRLPRGPGPFPVAMIVHGGCFLKGYATPAYMAPLATRLTEAGIATWNIDYRELGDRGGGWPGTFDDFAAAAAELTVLARRYPLDLGRVGVVGHSAGMAAAAFLAAGPKSVEGITVPPGVPNIARAVMMDGWPDFASAVGFDQRVCGRPVMVPLLGGTAARRPMRFAMLSLAAWPVRARVLLVGGRLMPPRITAATAAAVRARGGSVVVVDAPSASHFGMVAPGSDDFARIEPEMIALLKAP